MSWSANPHPISHPSSLSGQGLDDQGRLPDAGFALDPNHRSLVTAEGLDTSTKGRELLPAAHPLRRPVNGPHPRNVCLAQRRCLGSTGRRIGSDAGGHVECDAGSGAQWPFA